MVHMTDVIRDTLDTQFETYSIVRQLHDVPPHEVYEVTVDGRPAVCKVDTGETGSAGMEGRVTAFVAERTTLPVPGVLAVGEEYYVAEWHPDAPEPDGTFEADEHWAEAAGRGLATLHEETATLLDQYGQFRPGNSAGPDGISTTGHDGWHAAALEYVRQYRPTLARYGHDDIADAVLTVLEDHPDAFAGADGPVCCHGWATPEHVTVRDGDVACLVDFEHAIAAPGEFDYWRTVTPTFGPDTEAAKAAFREGYESVRPLPDGLDRRRPLYVVLNGVYYFESLYVQDQHTPEETERIAGRIRENVLDRLDDLP